MGIPKASNGARSQTSQTNASSPAAPTSLAAALFTRTQQRVLGLLFGQPDRSFYASEIISRSRSGSGAVQRELKRLASSGLVTVTRIGNQIHYQANHEAPVYAELCGLIKKTVGLSQPISASLAPLAQSIRLALLFGSVAKGTDTSRSDIDLLIVADDITLEDLFSALEPVETELQRKINPTLYSSDEFMQRKASNHAFITRVLSEEHIVLIGSENESAATR